MSDLPRPLRPASELPPPSVSRQTAKSWTATETMGCARALEAVDEDDGESNVVPIRRCRAASSIAAGGGGVRASEACWESG